MLPPLRLWDRRGSSQIAVQPYGGAGCLWIRDCISGTPTHRYCRNMLGRLETGAFAASPAWNCSALGCCFSVKQSCTGPLVKLWLWRDQESGAWTSKLVWVKAGTDSVISSVGYRLCDRLGTAVKLPVGHAGPLALGFSTHFHSGKQHPPRLHDLRGSCSSSSVFSSHRI